MSRQMLYHAGVDVDCMRQYRTQHRNSQQLSERVRERIRGWISPQVFLMSEIVWYSSTQNSGRPGKESGAMSSRHQRLTTSSRGRNTFRATGRNYILYNKILGHSKQTLKCKVLLRLTNTNCLSGCVCGGSNLCQATCSALFVEHLTPHSRSPKGGQYCCLQQGSWSSG